MSTRIFFIVEAFFERAAVNLRFESHFMTARKTSLPTLNGGKAHGK